MNMQSMPAWPAFTNATANWTPIQFQAFIFWCWQTNQAPSLAAIKSWNKTQTAFAKQIA